MFTSVIPEEGSSISRVSPFSEAISLTTFNLLSKLGCLVDIFCMIYIHHIEGYNSEFKNTIQTTEQTTIKINKTPQKPYLWINTAMVAQFNCRSSEVLSIPASKHLANLLQLRKVPTSRTRKYKTCYCFS